MFRILACFLVMPLTMLAQDLRKLPDWARLVATAAQEEKGPEDADAWVLLDRTEIAYTGSGEIRQRRFRLVKVLTERGRSQGTFSLRGLGGKASKVKKLKGWNLRPDNEMVKLDQDEVVTIHDAGSAEFSTETLTGARLDRVMKGSLIAFESLESIEAPLGPVAQEGLLEMVPVRRWELEVAKKEGWFTNLQAVVVAMDKQHFVPWIEHVEEVPGSRLAVSNLPALPKDEGGHPNLSELLPMVRVRFLDPTLEQARMWGSWDDLARWEGGQFRSRVTPAILPSGGGTGLAALRALHTWMGSSLTYKQVYLSPERGWIPERSEEVGRKRYGDCKDLTCYFLSGAASAGFTGFPVLANITGGTPSPLEAPFPVFDHVIVAVKLNESLGLPAEFDTPAGRFLLVDPTDSLTPLGYLGHMHRGRQLMICTDQGAQWVLVPETAIQPVRLALNLEGLASTSGRLQATLQIDETGDAWDLRSTAKARGSKGVHDRLVKDLLELPPTGQVLVESLGDPLDLSRPFQVKVKVDHPQGFRRNGGEYELVGWGIPGPRALIQKASVPRRYPVQAKSFGERVYRAQLKVPGIVQPLTPGKASDGPFSSYVWKASAEPIAGETTLLLALEHRWKDALYGFDRREEGVQAWKKDRNQFKAFREEALAFKVLP